MNYQTKYYASPKHTTWLKRNKHLLISNKDSKTSYLFKKSAQLCLVILPMHLLHQHLKQWIQTTIAIMWLYLQRQRTATVIALTIYLAIKVLTRCSINNKLTITIINLEIYLKQLAWLQVEHSHQFQIKMLPHYNSNLKLAKSNNNNIINLWLLIPLLQMHSKIKTRRWVNSYPNLVTLVVIWKFQIISSNRKINNSNQIFYNKIVLN